MARKQIGGHTISVPVVEVPQVRLGSIPQSPALDIDSDLEVLDVTNLLSQFYLAIAHEQNLSTALSAIQEQEDRLREASTELRGQMNRFRERRVAIEKRLFWHAENP